MRIDTGPIAARLLTAKTVAAAWQEYNDHVLPHDAGEIQRLETKRAFYSAADWAFKWLINVSADEEKGMAALSQALGEPEPPGQAIRPGKA